jgi:hypothetical protein
VTTDLKSPPPLTWGANAAAKARHQEANRRHEFPTIKLPYRVGGMAIRTRDVDVDASYLAGRAELMAYLRKYSAPCRPAIERWLTDETSAERVAVHHAFADLTVASKDGKAPIPDVTTLLKAEKLTPSALMSGVVDDRQLARA